MFCSPSSDWLLSESLRYMTAPLRERSAWLLVGCTFSWEAKLHSAGHTSSRLCALASAAAVARAPSGVGKSPCAAAVAEPPETRTSGRGTLFRRDAARLSTVRAPARGRERRGCSAWLRKRRRRSHNAVPAQREAAPTARGGACDGDRRRLPDDRLRRDRRRRDALGMRLLHGLIDPRDEQMAADMQRTVYEGSQTPTELRARARELRDQATLSDLHGVRGAAPIIQAGMGAAARHELAAAVSEAGGLGTIGGARGRIADEVPDIYSLWTGLYRRNSRWGQRIFGTRKYLSVFKRLGNLNVGHRTTPLHWIPASLSVRCSFHSARARRFRSNRAGVAHTRVHLRGAYEPGSRPSS